MVLFFLRGAFILIAASVTMLYVLPFQKESAVDFATVLLMLGLTLGITMAIVGADILSRNKTLSSMSGVFLGLLAGLLAAYALGFVVDLIAALTTPDNLAKAMAYVKLLQGVKVFIGLITCYLSISLVLQTKDDFRFVIPYVEFAKQIRGNRPLILDTSAIIDGRVLDILGTHIFQGSLIVPKFVLEELQTISDSSDKLKRARGRRGLEVLQKLEDNPRIDITLDTTDVTGVNVDQKLIAMAQETQSRIMTNDFNLNKIATLRGIDVINLNDLAKALRPVVLPGEGLRVKITKPGEGPTQGVGYMDDGTMVVVEFARRLVGQEVDLTVTSTLQTSAGRMIFGKADQTDHEPNGTGNTPPPSDGTAGTNGGVAVGTRGSSPGLGSNPGLGRGSNPGLGPATGRNPRRP